MLKTIKRFFSEHIATPALDPKGSEHRLQLATAALLLEVARVDFKEQDEEFEAVRQAIGRAFALPSEETRALVRLAQEEAARSTSYYEFTSLIKDHFNPEQKAQVIELMWRVAYADGHMDMYEEHLIRKIAELLYVPHVDFIAAKHRAQRPRA